MSEHYHVEWNDVGKLGDPRGIDCRRTIADREEAVTFFQSLGRGKIEACSKKKCSPDAYVIEAEPVEPVEPKTLFDR